MKLENSKIKKIQNTRVGQLFLGSAVFRSEVSLHQGLAVNILYVIIKVVSGIIYKSVWLLSFGVYYLLLAIMRGTLVHYVHSAALNGKKIGEDMRGEFRSYLACGVVLLLMNQVLALIVAYIVHENQGFRYAGFLIYAMALYAFYSIITAIINVIKYRKQGSPLLSAAKVISLTAALVSMLSLQTAMISEFGGDDYLFRRMMTAISGGVVCTFVLGMAIYMIVRSTRFLRLRSENGEQGED
jgi:hypothetical protein